VDLAGAAGEPVIAAGAGVVAFAGLVAGRTVVSVDHAGGLRTTYEPVSATVHTGETVGLGSPLGTLDAGHPGCPIETCLHWGLRRGATYLNPLLLLRPLRVRLKPLAGFEAAPSAARSARAVRRGRSPERSASIACTRREVDVATLMIRDLDEGVKARLRLRAAQNGRSMEAEARAILAAALIEPTTPTGLGSWIREQFIDLDAGSIEPPARTDTPRAADFGP
jgi:plasmid stability protein